MRMSLLALVLLGCFAVGAAGAYLLELRRGAMVVTPQAEATLAQAQILIHQSTLVLKRQNERADAIGRATMTNLKDSHKLILRTDRNLNGCLPGEPSCGVRGLVPTLTAQVDARGADLKQVLVGQDGSAQGNLRESQRAFKDAADLLEDPDIKRGITAATEGLKKASSTMDEVHGIAVEGHKIATSGALAADDAQKTLHNKLHPTKAQQVLNFLLVLARILPYYF